MFSRLRRQVRLALSRDRATMDLEEEMRLHRDLRAEALRREGRSEREARSEAARRFGNAAGVTEASRDAWGLGSWLDVLQQDIGYGWRSLRRAPGFTITVVLTLALGLGANLATFAVLDMLLLRAPSGVRDPDTLQRVWFESKRIRGEVTDKLEIGTSATYPMVRALVAASPPASIGSYYSDFALVLRRDGQRTRVRGTFATAGYFPVLGVSPVLGRVYTAAEDSVGAPTHVAVVGHRFWQRELGGDTAILGKRLNIEYEDYVIIGVLPADFDGLELQAADVWIPMSAIPAAHWLNRGRAAWWDARGSWGYQVIRRAGASTDDNARFDQRATAAVQGLVERLRSITHAITRVTTAEYVGGRLGEPGSEVVVSTRLSGVAAIVLAIACANVINLLLARAVRRRREIAVRLALGISRYRLVRLLTTETVLLALIAGGVAVLAAVWGGSLLRSLMFPQVQWYESVLHWRVLGFAFGISLFAGLVAGGVPALQSSNPELTSALKEGARDGKSHRSRLRQGLIVLQAGFSVVLLVGAALFLRSLANVRGLDIGYDADRVAFGSVRFERGQEVPNAVAASAIAELGERLQGRPGVDAVARASGIPMQGISIVRFYWDSPRGRDSSASLMQQFPTVMAVSPEYFDAVGMRMLRGSRFATGSERAPQIVVNEAMSALLWPGGEAIGRCLHFGKPDNPCFAVVGVVSRARQLRVIEDGDKAQLYLSLEHMPVANMTGSVLVVRARAGAMPAAMAEMSTGLTSQFPGAEVTVKTMGEYLEPEYRPWRTRAALFTGFGMLALLVAMIGMYSTVSYAVTQRMHEFGVRLALGARVRDVLRLVVGDGVRVVSVGVVIGIAAALAAGKLVASMLYGVQPYDPMAMLASAAVLLVVACLAALVPAWRASRVDPVMALRTD